jgi:uncharacterized protein (TIGR00725 family)
VSAPRVRRAVVGVMGAGETASERDVRLAEALGERIAAAGWALLTGGRDTGVMAAASRGAKRVAGSLTIGILPSESGSVAADVDVAVFTGMGNARNAVNVLTSDVVVACGDGGAGTASEIALAVKSRKPVVLLAASPIAREFVRTLGGDVGEAATVEQAIELVRRALGDRQRPV